MGFGLGTRWSYAHGWRCGAHRFVGVIPWVSNASSNESGTYASSNHSWVNPSSLTRTSRSPEWNVSHITGGMFTNCGTRGPRSARDHAGVGACGISAQDLGAISAASRVTARKSKFALVAISGGSLFQLITPPTALVVTTYTAHSIHSVRPRAESGGWPLWGHLRAGTCIPSDVTPV